MNKPTHPHIPALDERRRPVISLPAQPRGLFQGWGPRL